MWTSPRTRARIRNVKSVLNVHILHLYWCNRFRRQISSQNHIHVRVLVISIMKTLPTICKGWPTSIELATAVPTLHCICIWRVLLPICIWIMQVLFMLPKHIVLCWQGISLQIKRALPFCTVTTYKWTFVVVRKYKLNEKWKLKATNTRLRIYHGWNSCYTL